MNGLIRVSVKNFLSEAGGKPVPLKEIMEKTGASREDIVRIEKTAAIIPWAQLAEGDKPADDYLKPFSTAGTMATAREVVKFLLKNPDTIIRHDVLMDALEVSEGDLKFVMANFQSYGIVTSLFSLADKPDCEICHFRKKCRTPQPVQNCSRWNIEHRENKTEGQ